MLYIRMALHGLRLLLHAIVLEWDHVHLAAEELWELPLVDLPPQRLLQALVLHEHELRMRIASSRKTVVSEEDDREEMDGL